MSPTTRAASRKQREGTASPPASPARVTSHAEASPAPAHAERDEPAPSASAAAAAPVDAQPSAATPLRPRRAVNASHSPPRRPPLPPLEIPPPPPSPRPPPPAAHKAAAAAAAAATPRRGARAKAAPSLVSGWCFALVFGLLAAFVLPPFLLRLLPHPRLLRLFAVNSHGGAATTAPGAFVPSCACAAASRAPPLSLLAVPPGDARLGDAVAARCAEEAAAARVSSSFRGFSRPSAAASSSFAAASRHEKALVLLLASRLAAASPPGASATSASAGLRASLRATFPSCAATDCVLTLDATSLGGFDPHASAAARASAAASGVAGRSESQRSGAASANGTAASAAHHAAAALARARVQSSLTDFLAKCPHGGIVGVSRLESASPAFALPALLPLLSEAGAYERAGDGGAAAGAVAAWRATVVLTARLGGGGDGGGGDKDVSWAAPGATESAVERGAKGALQRALGRALRAARAGEGDSAAADEAGDNLAASIRRRVDAVAVAALVA